MSQGDSRIDLERRLGYTFRDPKLLERALTHASMRSGGDKGGDNERLEFLGDRVLGLAMAEMLHQRYPRLREGELARRFNRLVSGTACAEVARSIELGRFVILAESEAGSGGRDKDTILAGSIEAILGAVLLEAGFDVARGVVLRLWRERTATVGTNPVDAKSALQEWAQGRGLPLPRYKERARTGPDHAPEFVAEVVVDQHQPASARGSSKRQAEQAAAREFLEREGVWKVGDDERD